MSELLRPRFWGAHLLALVLLGAAVWLGLWQYDAWSARRAAEATSLTEEEPKPLADVIGPDDPFPGEYVGQPVDVAGTWVPDGTVYVSGREHDGRDGFWVVTPLAVGDTAAAPALLVVRGWTADAKTAPPAPTGKAEVTGWLQPAEGTGEVDGDPGDDVLPQLRIADAIQHVDQDLYGAYAVVTDVAATPASQGLQPATLDQLPEVGRFTGLRNLLYAVEWWFFGLFAAFIWWRWVREEVQPDAR